MASLVRACCVVGAMLARLSSVDLSMSGVCDLARVCCGIQWSVRMLNWLESWTGDGVWVGFLFWGDLRVLIVLKGSCGPTQLDLGATWGVGEGLLRGLKADCFDAKANGLLEFLAEGGLEGLGTEGLPVLLRAALYDPWVDIRGVGVGCCLGEGGGGRTMPPGMRTLATNRLESTSGNLTLNPKLVRMDSSATCR